LLQNVTFSPDQVVSSRLVFSPEWGLRIRSASAESRRHDPYFQLKERGSVTAHRALAAAVLLVTAGCSQHVTGAPRPVRAATTAPADDLHALVRQWWQRAAAIPESQYFDPKLCGLRQPADVWLLGGGAPKGEAHRRCAVPAHRPLLAPVLNEQILAGQPSPPALIQSPMYVRLDGRPMTPTRVDNDRPYAIRAVKGNAIAVLRDGARVTDRGYWVLLPGLTPGVHRLTIRTPAERERPSIDWTLTAT
jgi:hypothetical protein